MRGPGGGGSTKPCLSLHRAGGAAEHPAYSPVRQVNLSFFPVVNVGAGQGVEHYSMKLGQLDRPCPVVKRT